MTFCPRCAALRTRRLLIGIGLVVLSVVAVLVLAGTLPADSSYGSLAVVAFVALLLAGLIFIAQAGWAAIASAFASRNGAAVEVRRPAARFVEEAAPAQQWGAPAAGRARASGPAVGRSTAAAALSYNSRMYTLASTS